MLVGFEKKIADFLSRTELLNQPEKILLAVSGGADSIALLQVMCALKNEGLLRSKLYCAHLNHQLRGADANTDERFVIERASELDLQITTQQVDVRGYARDNKLSIETAARKVRIEFLLDVAGANCCEWIATGHQKNDSAETVVHNLLRGTGFRGLGGIWPVRDFEGKVKFVRPLLCVTRDEIVGYLREHNLDWRQDRTNIDCAYRRNYIRHKLLPVVQRDCAGPLPEQLAELAGSAQRFHKLIFGRAEKLWTEVSRCDKNEVVLNISGFVSEPEPVRLELIRRSLAAIGIGEGNMTQQHYRRILQLINRNNGGREVHLPGRLIVRREYGDIIFKRYDDKDYFGEELGSSVGVAIPGRTEFKGYLIEAAVLKYNQADFKEFKDTKKSSVEWFDLNRLKLPLLVRFRREGDRFWPLGMPKEKRLGKFLTAAHIRQVDRRKAVVVADIEKIIWVWPIRISEQVKVNGETREVLKLSIAENAGSS